MTQATDKKELRQVEIKDGERDGSLDTPSLITDHVFEPYAEWWTRCKHCPLSEAAHKETTLHHPIGYLEDDDE